jgi:membrane protein
VAPKKPLGDRLRAHFDAWRGLFARHALSIHASSIAFRTLRGLIPLVLFGLALLGALHEREVWRDQLAPPIKAKVTQPVFDAINSTVDRILTHGTAGLLAFAGALAVFDVSGSVRACMDGMNAIYEEDEERPAWLRLVVSVGLGVAIAACTIGAVLLVTAARSWGGVGVAAVRWLGAIFVIGLAVGLLLRYAPMHRRAKRWESAGAVLVVVSWFAASLLFKLFVSDILNFRSATGILAAFLVLTTYVYVSSIVFLVGVQLDELLREETEEEGHGLLDLVRRG